MTAHEIQRASTAQLWDRLTAVVKQMAEGPSGAIGSSDEQDDLEWEADRIHDELCGRKHDLSDPSSGLGCHLPS